MILKDLISPSINCARKAVNNPRSHLNNGANGVENKVGYVVIERRSNPVGFDASLVFIRSILLSDRVLSRMGTASGTASASGKGSLNLSLNCSLNFSFNFGLLRIRLSKLCFFLSSHLIFFLFSVFS